MGSDGEFRQKLVELADKVMHCPNCRQYSLLYSKDDLHQPGWVGRLYEPGNGLVVVLQNPAAPQQNDEAEHSAQRLLRELKDNPSIETHKRLTEFIFSDMAGEQVRGRWIKRRWRTWAHPVSKLVPDREKLAWMNVVKFRTPGGDSKDDPVPKHAVRHGATEHLQYELEALNPRAIVAIGSDAYSSHEIWRQRLPETTVLHHLKLRGARTVEVEDLRRELLDMGVDI